jgi:hypothetical protein
VVDVAVVGLVHADGEDQVPKCGVLPGRVGCSLSCVENGGKRGEGGEMC